MATLFDEMMAIAEKVAPTGGNSKSNQRMKQVRCTDCRHGSGSRMWCLIAGKHAGGRYRRSCEHYEAKPEPRQITINDIAADAKGLSNIKIIGDHVWVRWQRGASLSEKNQLIARLADAGIIRRCKRALIHRGKVTRRTQRPANRTQTQPRKPRAA